MSQDTDKASLHRLLETAYQQALQQFDKEVAEGARNPPTELPEYRKRRRDYATLLRMNTVPEEARALSERLLRTPGIHVTGDAHEDFESDVTRMLIQLYDAFIQRGDQGRR